jgi:NRPS condensation-like uncharacterized protein
MGVFGDLIGYFYKGMQSIRDNKNEHISSYGAPGVKRGAPVKTKKDYHRKGLLRVRVEHHTIKAIKEYAKVRDISVSEIIETFLAGFLWSKKAKKLKKILEMEQSG